MTFICTVIVFVVAINIAKKGIRRMNFTAGLLSLQLIVVTISIYGDTGYLLKANVANNHFAVNIVAAKILCVSSTSIDVGIS